MSATITRLPVAMKRGRKVTRGPVADIIHVGASVAERFACLLALEHSPDLSEESLDVWRPMTARVACHGMTHADINERIRTRRRELQRQLAELDQI